MTLGLRLPNGILISLVSGVPLNLPGLAEFTFPLSLPFQSFFPPGVYSLIASTTTAGATIDQDRFDFEFVTAATLGPVFTDVTALAGLNYTQAPPAETPLCLQPLDPQMPGPGFDCIQAAADYDNNGYPDLFLTRIYESDLLFHNRGDGTFEDVTIIAGLGGVRQTNGSAWVDIDNDGDRDLYVNTRAENRNYLFVNQGNGAFLEEAVSRGADIDTGNPH